jgi:hypothetical protein
MQDKEEQSMNTQGEPSDHDIGLTSMKGKREGKDLQEALV